MKKTTVLLATASLVAAIAGVAVAVPQKPKAKISAAAGRTNVELANTPFRGSENGVITIVEFVDYECPFCRKAEKTVQTLLERYPGQVRVQLAHNPLPFHANAAIASAAVLAAGEQGQYWELHDRLIASKKIDRALIEQHAAALGLNLGKFRADMETAAKTVSADVERAKTLGVRGTPAFFVNGRHIVGAQPFENFQRIVDEELAVASSLLRQGVREERVYEEVISGVEVSDDAEPEVVECVQKHDDGC